MPAGSWLLGVIIGLLSGLVALGMALVYRANRALNFAQGDLGAVPTILVVGLIAASGLSFWLAVPIGLVAALVLGALVEMLIIRRFFKSPRLLLMVATIGLSQLLIVSGLLLPRLWGTNTFADKTVTAPFDVHITLGSQLFDGNDLLALVVAPLVLVGLALFLRFTDVGIAIRASADRADRAGMLGIPVKRTHTLVWSLAACLSFIGLFMRTLIFGVTNTDTLSVSALAFALAALVLGRLDNLPAVVAAAVALGVIEQGVYWNNPDNPGLVYPVLAVIVLVFLILRRRTTSRKDADATASWRASEEIRPVPAELRDLTIVKLGRWALLALGLAAIIVLPLFLSESNTLKAAAVAVFAMIGLSVIVLTGWAGQVSLGQMSFVAVGGAVGALATSEWHVDLTVAIIVAGLAGAVTAVVVGLPALRLRGFYLAVTTLAFALASSNYLLNRQHMSWIPDGRIERPELWKTFDLTSQRAMYYVCIGCMVLAFVLVSGIRRSRLGRVLVAVRDNERGVQAYGVSVLRAKIASFALSGFIAAAAGCLFVHVNQAYTETPFIAAQSLNVLTAAVVGGLGSLAGAVIGAIYLQGGIWFLPQDWRLLPSGVGVLLVLMVLPGGIGSILFRGRDGLLRTIARRRGIVVASLLADVATADVVPRVTAAASHVADETEEREEQDDGLVSTAPGGRADASIDGGAQ